MGFTSVSELVGSLDRAAPMLVDIAIRSVAVLGLTMVATLCMRRASAAARHWVWLMGMAGLLMLPVLSLTLPGWHVLPRTGMTVATTFIIEPPEDEPAPVDEIAASAPVAASSEQTPARDENKSVPSARQEVTPAPAPAPAAKVATPLQTAHTGSSNAQTSAGVGKPTSARPPLPWTVWVMLLWITGSHLILGHILLGVLSLRLLQRRCMRLRDIQWQQLLLQLRDAMNLDRSVELLTSPQRAMPMTWGLLRTRVLLPEQADEWGQEQRRAVLLHELGHARRWDCVTQLLAQLACAAYWFNPLVWVAWNRMQVERERACDDLVLGAGAKASAYAEHLLRTASALPPLRFTRAAAIAMARPSTLEERLRAILDGKRNRRALAPAGAITSFLLLLTALVPVAVLRAQQNPAPEPTPSAGPAAPQPAAPNQQPLSIEERMRLRRMEQTQDAPAAPNQQPLSIEEQMRLRRMEANQVAPAQAQAAPAAADGPTCPLDAVVYEVRVPVDLIGRLDPEVLARAAGTTEDFEKALNALGASKPVYLARQPVRLSSESIVTSQNTPYVAGSTMGRNGQVTNRVAYAQTGTVFNLTGRVIADGRMEVDMNIQVSTLSESATAISGTISAPIFRSLTMSRKGMVQPDKAFVFLSADSSAVDANGNAVAFIARVSLGAPQSPAGAARGQ